MGPYGTGKIPETEPDPEPDDKTEFLRSLSRFNPYGIGGGLNSGAIYG